VADVEVPPTSPVLFYASFSNQRVFDMEYMGGKLEIVYQLRPNETRLDYYYNGRHGGWDNPYVERDALDNLALGGHEFHATLSGFDLETPPLFLVKATPKIFYFRYSRIVELGLLTAPMRALQPEILSYETRA